MQDTGSPPMTIVANRTAGYAGELPAAHCGTEAYRAKNHGYFTGIRRDYVSELPLNPRARILEVGCGAGETGSLALSQGRCTMYCGIEICPEAADKAAKRISQVLVGNVEALELPWGAETFDALILSEVLEHLADPWAALRKLWALLKPGAPVFASSPNVSNLGVIRMLLRGEWALADFGTMDRTHLRWFTPNSYRGLFESCGYHVDSVREMVPLSKKARAVSLITFGRLKHLFIGQIDLRAHRH